MSNPGRDMHAVIVGDVLLPGPQAAISNVTVAFAAFRPTVAIAEVAGGSSHERYTSYLAGTPPTSANEVVQLGFRLAKTAS